MTLFNPHQTKDQLIRRFDGLNLYQIGSQQLSNFSQFVFDIYNRHYLKKYQWSSTTQELSKMQDSDRQQFNHSIYFGFKDLQQIFLGTIKATKKQENIDFPIEYEFNIDLDTVCQEKALVVDDIWHLGRLAIDSETLRNKNLPIQSRQMLHLLLHYSLTYINEKPNNLMIAESDVLIYEIFHELGLNMQIVGAVQDCLGSPTYPVIITGEDISTWLHNNSIDHIIFPQLPKGSQLNVHY